VESKRYAIHRSLEIGSLDGVHLSVLRRRREIRLEVVDLERAGAREDALLVRGELVAGPDHEVVGEFLDAGAFDSEKPKPSPRDPRGDVEAVVPSPPG
jgi:hypothetical protein